MSENKVAITVDQLKELLTEMRKPVLTEKEIRAEQEFQEDRRRTHAEQLEIMRNTEMRQKYCSHKHRNGTSRMVNVNLGEYFLCQLCQKIARPDTDPQIYNEHIQMGSLADI
jgi:hypothetical protein